jgi:hypothetical protein
MLPALLILSAVSCGQATKIAVVVDGASGIAVDASSLTDTLAQAASDEKLSATIDYRVQNGAMDEAKKDPLSFLSRTAQEKPSDPAILLVFRPYEDSVSRSIRYEALAASWRSSVERLTASNQSLTNALDIVPALREFARSQGEKALDRVYTWGPRKLVAFALLDNPSNVSFDSVRFCKSFEDLTRESYSGPVEFRKIESNGAFPLLTNSPAAFLRALVPTDNAVIAAVRPYANSDGSNGVEFVAANALANAANITVTTNFLEDASSVYKDIRNAIADPASTGWYFWKRPEEIPLPPPTNTNVEPPNPVVTNTAEYIEYRNYRDTLELPGRYLLVTSVPQIAPAGKFRLSDLLVNGVFDPKTNPVALSLKKTLADGEYQSLFIGTNGSRIAGLYFFEYVTTGDTYGRLLFGPVDETNVQTAKDVFAKAGITLFARTVKGSDFR